MSVNLDEVNMSCLAHEHVVHNMYGEDVIHVSNFSENEDKVRAVCETLPHVFIGAALIGDGSYTSKDMIGVYADDVNAVTEFWNVYWSL